MAEPLYLDTSAVLRATLEAGLTAEVERRLDDAELLLASRLALVETARAIRRVRLEGRVSEAGIADVQRALGGLWARCAIWEINKEVCDLACEVAPRAAMRALDAIHLATFALARRRIPGLEMLTTDERMRAALEE